MVWQVHTLGDETHLCENDDCLHLKNEPNSILRQKWFHQRKIGLAWLRKTAWKNANSAKN